MTIIFRETTHTAHRQNCIVTFFPHFQEKQNEKGMHKVMEKGESHTTKIIYTTSSLIILHKVIPADIACD